MKYLGLALFALVGCVYESGECPPVLPDEVLMLRVTDLVTGNDITSTGVVDDVVMMVFDENGTFITRLDAAQEQLGGAMELPEALRELGAGTKLQISAWGNLVDNAAFQAEYGAGHKLASEFIQLRTNTEYLDNWYNPGPMYFGLTTITLGAEHVHTIPLAQKTARMAVTVRGLPAGSSADDYYFSMCEQNDGFTFNGDPLRINEWCKIREKGVFTTSGDFTTPEPYYVIPSADPNDVSACNAGVCLYKVGGGLVRTRASHALTSDQGTRALTSDQAGYITEDGDINVTGKARSDSAGNHLALVPGQTTNVLITLNSTGDIAVQVEMTPWNEVYQWNTW